jgi:ribosomal protein S30
VKALAVVTAKNVKMAAVLTNAAIVRSATPKAAVKALVVTAKNVKMAAVLTNAAIVRSATPKAGVKALAVVTAKNVKMADVKRRRTATCKRRMRHL